MTMESRRRRPNRNTGIETLCGQDWSTVSGSNGSSFPPWMALLSNRSASPIPGLCRNPYLNKIKFSIGLNHQKF